MELSLLLLAAFAVILLGFTLWLLFERQQTITRYASDRTEALTRLQVAQEIIHSTRTEREAAHAHARHAEEQAEAARRDLIRIQEQMQATEKRMADWEQTKQESFTAAREAMFTTGGDIFRKEAEALQKKTGEGFALIMQAVSHLQERVGKSENTVDTVWRALSSPGGAGRFAEIGLANTLKNFGLEEGRDFITQFTVTADQSGLKLRPDAVLFLPGEYGIVIDSKASKFFLELAEAEGTPEEEATAARLLKTMREHVKALASKGYRDAVHRAIRDTGQTLQPDRILMVMFLQSDRAVEKLYQLDPSFRQRPQDQQMIIAGPAGIEGLISLAYTSIAHERQRHHNQEIISELSELLGNLHVVFDHARKFGQSLHKTAEHYQAFSKSVNTRLLPRSQRICKMGVSLPKNKTLPGKLDGFQVIRQDESLIEGEASEAEEMALLTE